MKLRHALFALGALGLGWMYWTGIRGLSPIGSYHGAYGQALSCGKQFPWSSRKPGAAA